VRRRRRGWAATAAAAILTLASAGCHSHAIQQEKGGWCEECKIGWADGKKFTNPCCYDAYVIEGEDCPVHGKPR
jgi:hypothetical protein